MKIVKLIKFIMTLASLVASVEAIMRLVKFAWALFIQLKKVFRVMPGKKFGTFGRRTAWA